MDYSRLIKYQDVVDFIKENNATRLDCIKNPSDSNNLHFELNNEEKTAGTIDDRLQLAIKSGEKLIIKDITIAVITNQKGEVLFDLRFKESTDNNVNTITIDLTKAGHLDGKYPEVFLSPLAYTCLAGYPPEPDKPVRPTYIEQQSYQSEGRLLKGTYWLLAGILCPMLLLKSGEPLFLFFWTLIIFNAIAIYYFVKHFKNKNAFINMCVR